MAENVKLGFQENAGQFTLLLLINAFVGGMVGMERSIFVEFVKLGFDISAHSAILTFIAVFGLTSSPYVDLWICLIFTS